MNKFIAPLAIMLAGAICMGPVLAATDEAADARAARLNHPAARVMLSQVTPGMIDPAARSAKTRIMICVPSEPGTWSGYDIWNAVTCGPAVVGK